MTPEQDMHLNLMKTLLYILMLVFAVYLIALLNIWEPSLMHKRDLMMYEKGFQHGLAVTEQMDKIECRRGL